MASKHVGLKTALVIGIGFLTSYLVYALRMHSLAADHEQEAGQTKHPEQPGWRSGNDLAATTTAIVL